MDEATTPEVEDERDAAPPDSYATDEASDVDASDTSDASDNSETVGADDPVAPDEPARMYAAATTRDRVSFAVDDDELVGDGGFPLRFQPAAAIAPGTADALRLLMIWFVRKSFYWLFFSGVTIGFTIAILRHDSDVDVDVSDPGSLTGGFVLVLVALGVRFGSGWVALALTAPLVFAHEQSLSPRENFGKSIGIFFDRLNIAKSFRALRWTHHVRQVAQHRLGETGRRLGKLDPILDIVNITTGVLAFVVPIVVAGIVGTT